MYCIVLNVRNTLYFPWEADEINQDERPHLRFFFRCFTRTQSGRDWCNLISTLHICISPDLVEYAFPVFRVPCPSVLRILDLLAIYCENIKRNIVTLTPT